MAIDVSIGGLPFLEFMDDVLGVILLPIGALATVVAFIWYNHKAKLLVEVNKYSSIKFGSWVVWIWKYLIPMVLVVFLGYLLAVSL